MDDAFRLQPRGRTAPSPGLADVLSAKVLVAIAGVCFVAALVARRDSTQVFVAGGLSNRLATPALLLLSLAMGWRAQRLIGQPRRAPLDRAVFFLVPCVVVSLAGTLARGYSPRAVVDLAAFGLFLTSYWCGRRMVLGHRALRSLLLVGAVVATVQIVSGFTPFPLYVLAVPGAAALGLVGWERRRVTLIAASAALLTLLWVTKRPGSDSTKYQIGAVVVLLALPLVLHLPSGIRSALLAGCAVLGLVVVVGSPLPALVAGRYAGSDPTLQQRAFEVAAVKQQVLEADIGTALVGRGPGGTVSLLGSPDAPTLAAAGRDLTRVPTVHILVAQVVLKLGLLGLLWLLVLLAIVLQLGLRSLHKREYTKVALTAFILCAVVDAFSAADHLFTNPVPIMLLGVLISANYTSADTPALPARERVRRG